MQFRNSLLLVATLLVFTLVFQLRKDSPHQVREIDIPAEKQAYIDLFEKEVSHMAHLSELEDADKYTRPDMFFEFDRLQRMDPKTGKVPEFALVNAYKAIQAQFPPASTQKTNFALDWEERGPGNIGGRTRAVMFDPNDSNSRAVFAGGVGGGLWKTENITVANPTWVSVNPVFSNVAVTCIGYDPSNTQVMYFGTGEGWRNADAQRGAGIWKSVDGGKTWNVLPATEISDFFYSQKIVVTGNGTLYVATKGGLQKSTDGGQSFTRVLGQGTGAGSSWITDLEMAGNGDLYAGSNGSGIYKSAASLGAQQGEVGQWTRLNLSFNANTDRVELAVGQNNPNYVYALLEANNQTEGVYRSTDGGSSWSATPSQPANGNDFSNGQAWYDLCIEVDPTNENIVIVGAIDLWKTSNGGNSWIRISRAYGNGSQPYVHPDQHSIVYRPGNSDYVLFGNDGGLYLSGNGGSSFGTRNTGYNVTQFYTMSIDPRPGNPIIIGGTQDNGTIMVTGSGITPGDHISGGDGAFCAIDHQFPDTMYTTSQWATTRRSRNGGQNFTGITNPNLNSGNTLFINPLEIDPNNSNILYQASRRLWRHSNPSSGGGGGWIEATVDLGSQITAIGISESTANLVYAAAGGVVYRLPRANQANFTTQPDDVNAGGTPGGYISCVAVDPNDGNHIIITLSSFGLIIHVAETRNADMGSNATWKDLSGNLPDLPVNWAVYEPNNPNGVLIGTDLGVFRCADITVPSSDIFWSPERNGMGMPRVNMMEVRRNDKTVHAATHGRGFFSTDSYNQAPQANFGVEQTTVCDGLVHFIDSSRNAPVSWFWDFGDGNTSTTSNPVHQYDSSGTYTVKMVISNPNGTDSVTQTYTITVLPPAVAVAGPDLTACSGGTVTLSASGGVSYRWIPDVGLSNANIANPSLVVNGTRTFVVEVTDANGCTAVDTQIVTMSPAPNVWAGQDQTITQVGDSVQLQAQGAVTYEWTPAKGLSCTQCANPKAYRDSTTEYTVTGYNADSCFRSDKVLVIYGIVSVDDPDPAKQFRLLSLAPNPTNGAFTMVWNQPRPERVNLEIIDLNGRLLRKLDLGIRGTGEQQLSLDRNTELSGIAEGAYFLRMTAGEARFSTRLLVIE